MKGLTFTKKLPGFFLEEEKMIAVGDLHIGRDLRLMERGIYLPDATAKMSKDLLRLCSEYGADSVALLGDVKESIGYPEKAEYAALLEFFYAMRGVRILIAKGNHDSRIEEIVKNSASDVEITREILLKDAALMHGHSLPSKEAVMKRYIITGHSHPALEIKGRLEKVYAVLKRGIGMSEEYKRFNRDSRLVILPAFNSMLTGSDIMSSGDFSPMLKHRIFDMGSARLYGLDGKPIRRIMMKA